MAKKAPAKPAAKRKPRAKKPVQPDSPFELSEFSPGTIRELRKILDGEKAVIDQAIKEAETHLVKPAVKSSSLWRRLLFGGAVVAGLVVSFGSGVWSAGGINVGPKPVVFSDSLAESHKADRATQVRILREYAGKSFANEPEAKDWLNAQRIEARKNDFAPYTDELGNAADVGPDAVKALADKLEGKR